MQLFLNCSIWPSAIDYEWKRFQIIQSMITVWTLKPHNTGVIVNRNDMSPHVPAADVSQATVSVNKQLITK